MRSSVRRRQDDHGAARPPDPPLPYRGDGERLLPFPAQQHGRQGKNQSKGAEKQDRQGCGAAGTVLICSPREGQFASGYARRELPLVIWYTYPQPQHQNAALSPGSKFNQQAGSNFNQRQHLCASGKVTCTCSSELSRGAVTDVIQTGVKESAGVLTEHRQ